MSKVKSECGRGLTRFFGVAANHNNANIFLMLMKLLTRTMKETDDDEWDGDRNELMTTMMRTKKMMRMTKMMKMMRMMRTPKMRMKMKMRMMIMMSRAVVGLQNLLGPASETLQFSHFLSRQVL
jgi:hypothetical protein